MKNDFFVIPHEFIMKNETYLIRYRKNRKNNTPKYYIVDTQYKYVSGLFKIKNENAFIFKDKSNCNLILYISDNSYFIKKKNNYYITDNDYGWSYEVK